MKKQKGTDYYANRHSCFLLQYHLVVVTKFRHPVIVNDIKERLLELTSFLIQDKWGCNLISANTDMDHIHILFEAPPQIQLSALVNNYKTVTSRRLRSEYASFLENYYWKPYFWSDSYFICSVSDKSKEIIADYIANQGAANPA